MKTLKLNKELNPNSTKEQNLEVEKLRRVNEFDYIFGLSDTTLKNSEMFFNNNDSSIPILVDETKELISLNKFDQRFELIVQDGKIVEYKKDPDLTTNFLLGLSALYFLFFICYFNIKSYFHFKKVAKTWGERKDLNKEYTR